MTTQRLRREIETMQELRRIQDAIDAREVLRSMKIRDHAMRQKPPSDFELYVAEHIAAGMSEAYIAGRAEVPIAEVEAAAERFANRNTNHPFAENKLDEFRWNLYDVFDIGLY
jgi:hypothetical protein